ncbi:TIR domain-containing protein [Leptothoe spongobia]|uniref:TIR domain-containing protein n=1 Tax=Leptothoe spongobia TAU-MAC 1115 TaxID=1967444 RepID=A0A947DBF9_9CYAN|nr:TIR domain-containing protein [Leptothoe spongobia]MBT9314093.1 TIR domain-containing protein [Leptothoe spongobia TAU-MAC 1115]
MPHYQDAFISYGRADSKAFVEKLRDQLVAQGLKVWFDFEDIPLGVDYQKQIDTGIDQADNFLFIISPHAVNSPHCRLEIERALLRHKRIIPLMHVEEISRATWQQRNPQGTDQEWDAYTTAGKQSSFANMHPAIAKINWIYCREGNDDQAQALQGLLTIFQSQQPYVHRHTALLNQALRWQQHQKQSRYLLIGADRQAAEAWLTTQFKDEQPPCIPTDLHCEFITESTKNANNLMTQVFLAHAEEDKHFREQLRQRLMRENITVWTNKTDILTGTDFKRALKTGIEETDNVIYLLSPAALTSTYCQREIKYAQLLNKRIIPLLIKPVDLQQLPPRQRTLQFINFSDNITPEQDKSDVAKLLRILHHRADYHNEHKQLLTKALKWKRQHRNPSILLRGYNLRHAEAWLKVAQGHQQQGPTNLQTTFITESLRQPPASSLDVFISYSRSDSEFARQLNDTLQIQGKTTWFDQESISSGADFQQEIYRGIASADNFLFVLSPRAVNSPYCADEVAYAASLNKRFIPLLYQSVNPQQLPPDLAKVQWIDFSPQNHDFLTSFSQLVRTLDTDRNHVQSHTKWSQRAIEWDHKKRSADLLLRGSELVIAETWLQEATTGQKQPPATALQQSFIGASHTAQAEAAAAEQQRQDHLLQLQQERAQEAETRLAEQKKYAKHQRWFVGLLSGLLMMATGLAVVAFMLYGSAQVSKRRARNSEQQAKANEVEAISRTAEAQFISHHELDALREAIRAGKNLETITNPNEQQTIPVIRALGSVLYGIREANRFSGHTNLVSAISVSPDGQTLASASWDHTLRLWQQDGKLLHILRGHQQAVYGVVFSPDGKTIASASEDKTIKLWNTEGTLLKTLTGHQKTVRAVVFSPDGKRLVSAGDDGEIRIWHRDGTLSKTLSGHDGQPILALNFSPDGQTLASGGRDGTLRLWFPDQPDKPPKTLTGHSQGVYSVSFSPDGATLASGSSDRTIRLWNIDGTLRQTLQGHAAWVDSVAFSHNGERLASASRDRTIKIWRLDGRLLTTLKGHENEVQAVAFSSNHQLFSAGADNTIRVWKIQEELFQVLDEHKDAMRDVSFSPDGGLMAVAEGSRVIKLWNTTTDDHSLLQILQGHEKLIYSVNFSPNGKTLVSTSDDQTIKVWQVGNDQPVRTLTGHQGRVYASSFSPDGKLLATSSSDRTIKLWDLDTGNLLQTLFGHTDRVYDVNFSPDGQWLASTGRDTTVHLWQRQSQDKFAEQPKRSFVLDDGDRAWNRAVEFSPDGQTLAVAGYDKAIRLWSLEGKLLKTLKGHGAWVYGVSFHPDGQLLASASGDKTIKLWQLDGSLLLTLVGHNDWVFNVAFQPNNRKIVSASADGKIIRWTLQLELEKLMNHGCDWARFYLHNNIEVDESDRKLCRK